MTGDGRETAPAEKEELLRMSRISLILDSYDDIFSDFDPRPYSQRLLSDDFLSEARKEVKEKKTGEIELDFLIPSDKRSEEDERVIKKRLHEYFRKHYKSLQEEMSRIRRNSLIAIVLGMCLMVAATYVSTYGAGDFTYNLLLVLLEPGGWFITWYALDQLFYNARQKKADLEFHKKMSRCEINFTAY
ncbi:MAG: hypothetical protein JW724_03435 [Candidatus Altiarchaeota archaeon]|nr:hypothetical protein [Candidatus Altiarchaeota archaeon]